MLHLTNLKACNCKGVVIATKQINKVINEKDILDMKKQYLQELTDAGINEAVVIDLGLHTEVKESEATPC